MEAGLGRKGGRLGLGVGEAEVRIGVGSWRGRG